MEVFTTWKTWEQARPAVAGPLADDVIMLLDRAVDFALQWHGDQTRPTGTPYLEHLLEALEVLVNGAEVHDRDVLVTAILHDVVEDTPCTLDDVEAAFGPSVARWVDWVTKPPPKPGVNKALQKAGYLAALWNSPSQPRLVKLADRASNVQTLDLLPGEAKRRAYYAQTVTYIVPLAEPFPWFAAWYTDWQDAFAYLAEPTN